MIAAIIQARMGSMRLPGKVLREVAGEPLLGHQLSRVKRAKTLDHVVVATTRTGGDDAIASFCAERGVPVFRGSDHDVLSRYAGAASSCGADVVVRLTADCPLIDPDVIDSVVHAFLAADPPVDFASNTLAPYTFPEGMDTEVMSRQALERADREASDPGEREHVTFHIWMNPAKFRILKVDHPENLSSVRLTVDYAEDLDVIEPVLTQEQTSGPLSMAEIVALLRRRQLPEHPPGIVRNAGWPERFRQAAEDAGGSP